MNTTPNDGPGASRAEPEPATSPLIPPIRIPNAFSARVEIGDMLIPFLKVFRDESLRRKAMLGARKQIEELIADYGMFAEFGLMLGDAAEQLVEKRLEIWEAQTSQKAIMRPTTLINLHGLRNFHLFRRSR